MNYPNYPDARFRLPAGAALLGAIPDGAWNAGGQNPDGTWIDRPLLPTADDAAQFRASGYRVDTLNRPLHPNLEKLVRGIGVCAGRGALWQWGPNFTADSVVLTDDAQVLLIQRGDTGAWALPGGFRDYTGGQIETAKTAAARELTEETGLKLDPKRAGWLGHLVCDDLRATAHAWIETDGFCWRISAPVATQAGDDALDAGWFSLNELPEEMSATHTVLIRRATADLKLIPEKRRT